MKFNTITYERSKGERGYNYQGLKLTIEISETEDPLVALDWLKARVDNELGFTQQDLEAKIEKLQTKKEAIEHEVAELERLVYAAKIRWDKAKAFLEKNGVPVPKVDDDIPF